jgi:imidazolonepropionase
MLLINATLAAMDGSPAYGLVEQGAVAIEKGLIAWAGRGDAIPAQFKAGEVIDLEGRLVTPALIDCHTHVVHGGNRAREFEMRLEGSSYEEIARSGGGIVSTVAATRAATKDELVSGALARVDAMIAEGVSTIEIKSGYGLDIDNELKMLRAARAVAERRPVRVRTSFLGAHAVPPEYRGRPDAYIGEVCIPGLEAAHAEGLVDAVDGFCEGIAFTRSRLRRCSTRPGRAAFRSSCTPSSCPISVAQELAAEYGALSADHLEYATADDAAAMAKAGSVAVILPGAFYTLRETVAPPIQAFREAGVPMAVATDCNPGSSPMSSLLLSMNMACTLFRMTPEEALAGVTRNAARALGLDDAGQIKPGLRADLAIWNVEHPAELAYRIGFNPLWKRIFGGAL